MYNGFRKRAGLIILILCALLMLSGCMGGSSRSWQTEAGDRVKVSLQTNGGWKLTDELPFEVINPDGETVLTGTFGKTELYDTCVDSARTDVGSAILEVASKEDDPCVFWSSESDGETSYNCAISIGNSRSALLLNGNESEEETREAVERLTVTCTQKASGGAGQSSASSAGSGSSPADASDGSSSLPEGTLIPLSSVDINPDDYAGPEAPEYAIQKQTIWNQEGIKISIVSMTYSLEEGLLVQTTIENNSTEVLNIRGGDTFVNNCLVADMMFETVNPGEQIQTAIEIWTEDLNHYRIKRVSRVHGDLELGIGTDYTEEISVPFVIETGQEKAPMNPWEEVGKVIYFKNGIKIQVLGWMPPDYGSEELVILVHNDSDRNYSVNLNGDQTVNGQFVAGSFWQDAPARSWSIGKLIYSSEEVPDPIETIRLSVSLFNEESFETVDMSDYVTFELQQ